MHPATIIAGLVIALLVIIYAWTGMPLAWAIVMLLAIAIIALLILLITTPPRWPG